MTLRVRLTLAFALVAVGTAAAVAIATPPIIRHGFERLGADDGRGGYGRGPGPMSEQAATVQADTEQTIVIVAGLAALAASAIGLLAARSMTRPLEHLREVAGDLARGRLDRRSGLGRRSDEVGSLGRSFDAMAEALDRSEDARRRLLQDAAHEFRTPLAVIEATTGAILDGVYEPTPEHIVAVRDQGRLLTRIVDDLRTVGLAEGGVLPLERARIDAAAAIDEVARAHAPRAAGKQVVVRAETPPESAAVWADPDRLRQVLSALVDNGIRHTPAGGEVVLSVEPAGDACRLYVRDTGPGFDARDLPHVFDRFYQADRSRDRSVGSAGLGLAIARALVAAQGGTIGARNRSEGGGEVWIALPAVDDTLVTSGPG